MEIFKDIPGYEFYQVSNIGRVKSLERTIIKGNGINLFIRERILRPGRGSHGYLTVSLCDNKKVKSYKVSVLMAMAFMGHIPNGHKIVVDHINTIRTDNRLSNLQLITQRKNSSKDRKNGTSRFTGVSWSKANRKWQVSIQINGHRKYLGYFTSELQAGVAYKKELLLKELQKEIKQLEQ